jgi:hypothetical protein
MRGTRADAGTASKTGGTAAKTGVTSVRIVAIAAKTVATAGGKREGWQRGG